MTGAPPGGLLHFSTRTRTRLRLGTLTVAALLVPLAAAVAAETTAASTLDGAMRDAQALHDRGDFAGAHAAFLDIASREGPLYLFARETVDDARRHAALSDVDWARSLAAGGQVDQAFAVAGWITDAMVSAQAQRTVAEIAISSAQAAASRGDYEMAVHDLDLVAPGSAPPDLVATASAARPGAQLGAARQQLSAGDPAGAVVTLQALVAAPGEVTAAGARARALLPVALLAAGRQALGAGDPQTALGYLEQVVTRFGASQSAMVARRLLSMPTTVTGTLLRADGSAARGAQVRLGSGFRLVGGGFLTDPPYYAAVCDRNGIFLIPGVPIRVGLVLEFNDGSGWSVRTERDAAGPPRPADRVDATPLGPVDLGFVREPA